MVEPPALRDKEREGYAIRYAERWEISMSYIERLEIPAGWLNISSPELTAVDMVAYQEHIGGLTRAATVLEELSLKLDFTKLDADFLKVASASVFQRLGYLLDCVLGEESIADGLHALMKAGGMKMKAVPFRLGASVDDAEVDKKWKLMTYDTESIHNPMGYGCTMVFSALGGAGSNYLQGAGVYIQRPLPSMARSTGMGIPQDSARVMYLLIVPLYRSSLRPIDRFDSPSKWRRNTCLISFISLHLPAMACSIYG